MDKGKKQVPGLSQRQLLRQDLRLFSVLSQREEEFLEQEAELASDPLFARLCAPSSDGTAPVIRRRLQGASYAFSHVCSDAAFSAAAESGGAGEWLADRPAMLELARRAGRVRFEKFFLSSAAFSPGPVARACGFTEEEASRLKTFVDAFVMTHERLPAASLPRLYLSCAAVISADGGALSVAYTHPSYFRGEYRIDRRALLSLVQAGAFTPAEARKASALLSRAQRLSWRRSGFHRVLTSLADAQADFLLGRSALKPLSQRELASRAGLDPATVSRLVSSKSIIAPWGEEIRLKSLFAPKKAIIIDKIKDILGGSPGNMTDNQLADALNRDCGLKISRRSVNLYRKKAGL